MYLQEFKVDSADSRSLANQAYLLIRYIYPKAHHEVFITAWAYHYLGKHK